MEAKTVVAAARRLAKDCATLSFGAPVTHVYHPLLYAWSVHRQYLERYATAPKTALFVGINPGPWGMAQTGIPFGDVVSVREWLGLSGTVRSPAETHPKRPVHGLACHRREVSGQRLWDFFRSQYGTPEQFFARHLVLNYCPLLFIGGDGGRAVNLTPDKLDKKETAPLYAACDRHLRTVVRLLSPSHLIGVGGFAHQRLLHTCGELPGLRIGQILHPSPANPRANRGFAGTVAAQLAGMDIPAPEF